MSNLRAGTPSSRGRRRRSSSPLMSILILIAAALLIGIVIGFVLGRSTAKEQPKPAQPITSSDTSADVSAETSADASASSDGMVPLVTETDTEPEAAPAPIPEPEPQPAEPTGIKVCIDAGHGGNDGGTSKDDRLEKEDNLRMAEVLKEKMEFAGIEVVMTREEDKYVHLDDRCYIANQSDADYLISLHRNSFDGNVKGVEVWRSHNADDEALSFAEHIHEGLVNVGISSDRGVREGSQGSPNFDLQMNRNTEMASVLVELGFIDVPEDNKLYDDNMEDYCLAMVQAVLDTYQEFHK